MTQYRVAAVAAAFALFGQMAQAAPITFFGEDLNPAGTVDPTGNAASAKGSFLSSLSGNIGTEDFEDATEASLDCAGSGISGSMSLNGGSIDNAPNTGRFATSGSTYVSSGGGLEINFGTAINAFGFYGTDVGDFGSSLSLILTDINNATTQIDITEHSLGYMGDTDGRLMFFGFIDTMNQYTKVTFLAPEFEYEASEEKTVMIPDVFGIDDVTIAEISPVPVPASLPLLVVSLAGLYGARRVKRSK